MKMNFTLEQAEIEKIVADYVRARSRLDPSVGLEIEMKATRGEGGFTANISGILPGEGVEVSAPVAKATPAVVKQEEVVVPSVEEKEEVAAQTETSSPFKVEEPVTETIAPRRNRLFAD